MHVFSSLESQLGSGQFGTVYKGVWHSDDGDDVSVAVKTLKEEAVQGDRIKFLQEAAIMGQFKDPNVVTLHGIVIDEEPVELEAVYTSPVSRNVLFSFLFVFMYNRKLDLVKHITLHANGNFTLQHYSSAVKK